MELKKNIDEFLKVTSGVLIQKKKELFYGISFDTRMAESIKGSVFFALKNKRDGHDFLNDAYQKQAHVLVINNLKKLDESIKNKVTVIQVSDPLQSLSRWASYWREKLRFTVIGITGSNGKTSTKHFCQILLNEDPTVKVSHQSYNNTLGVCLGIFQLDSKDQVLIQEMGVSHQGDMEKLCSIAKPDASVCTTIGLSHAEGLGDREQISREKEIIYQYSPHVFGIFNLDNFYTLSMKSRKSRFNKSCLVFSSQNSKANVFLQVEEKGEDYLYVKGHIQGKSGRCRVPLSGEHHLTSIMASLCVALFLGKKPENLWSKLSLLKSPRGRCQFLTLKNKIRVFYDAYNSNPQSAHSFVDHLKIFQNQKESVLCLGDMLELGNFSEASHKKLGCKIASLNFGHVFFVGQYKDFFEKGLKEGHFKGKYLLFEKYNKNFVSKILSVIKIKGILAIKASRGMKLDRLLKDLEKGE